MLKILFDFTAKAFEDIIKEVADVEIKRADSFIISSPTMMSAVVGVSGISGRIILTTIYQDAKNIATYMNFGDANLSEEDVFLYFAEFANMYCGRATTYMNDEFHSKEIEITPPSIFTADDLKVISPNLITQKAYYQTSFGSFIVDVGSVDSDDDF